MLTSSRVAVTRDGILIDGQPLFLLAGQLHYFRLIPVPLTTVYRRSRTLLQHDQSFRDPAASGSRT